MAGTVLVQKGRPLPRPTNPSRREAKAPLAGSGESSRKAARNGERDGLPRRDASFGSLLGRFPKGLPGKDPAIAKESVLASPCDRGTRWSRSCRAKRASLSDRRRPPSSASRAGSVSCVASFGVGERAEHPVAVDLKLASMAVDELGGEGHGVTLAEGRRSSEGGTISRTLMMANSSSAMAVGAKGGLPSAPIDELRVSPGAPFPRRRCIR